MMQELHQAISAKMFMENAILYAALKAENQIVWGEPEELHEEVQSMYLSQAVLYDFEKIVENLSRVPN